MNSVSMSLFVKIVMILQKYYRANVYLWKPGSKVPNYLYDLLPKHNAETVSYSLRNNEHIKLPMSKKELFRRSFFPSAIRLWNKLKTNVRNAPSLKVLKLLLKKEFPEKPTLYYYGERWTSVHHSRLRMQCSKLNYDLHDKMLAVTHIHTHTYRWTDGHSG